MAIQLFDGDKCIKICLKNTNEYVKLAVEDLRKDFSRISEYRVCPEFTNNDDYTILIEENFNQPDDPVEDESFTIKTENKVIKIIAPSYLGTMWAIYTFSEKCLGVDPCYIFNDLQSKKQKSLIIDDVNIVSEPKSLQFRGFFINDEDLLTGWKNSNFKRN